MQVSFDSYKVFYITAKNKSITQAAKELYVTQPTVTHCIQKLEEELGCALFIRGKKGVKLTPEGKILYKRISIACEEIWKAENDMKALKEFKKGEILLGASETTLHYFLLPHLKKYKKKYPNIRMKIHNSTTQKMLDSIRNDELDCGILVFPEEYDDNEGVEIMTLATFQDIAIVGNEYKELAESNISLKDLVSYPIISLQDTTMTNWTFREIFKQYNLDLNPDIELATTDLIVPTVSNDLGIGFVPEYFADEALKRKEVFKLNLIEKIPRRKICLVYKLNKPQSKAVEAFIEGIKESV
ncbi:LysR family transcriptional regulator [Clostridium sp. SM-530-WT-3G]|uniref:LysR family transcriptional regulator n=1 Tax=Clostridium sp. SM-530-WT-3G TaxID=2725303 RepID=UPI00145F43A6|nr:LysR family transcriptional regulator [Clostridium sp. SM-530-WT-3G]NME82522.1 LysR family transcriptional regulator [Clostridium sp. SM-530-WT-3G]